MAGPLIVALGSQLLRIGAKELPKLLKKGAKLIKKPTLTQRKRAKLPKDSPNYLSGAAKKKKSYMAKQKPDNPTPDQSRLPSGAADRLRNREGFQDIYGAKSTRTPRSTSKARKDKDGNFREYEKVDGSSIKELDPTRDIVFSDRFAGYKKGGGVKKPRGVGKARQGVRAAKMVVMKGS